MDNQVSDTVQDGSPADQVELRAVQDADSGVAVEQLYERCKRIARPDITRDMGQSVAGDTT